MKVLILGASGGVGSRIVNEALGRGHEVTAQGRAPGRLVRAPEGVRVAVGNPTDPAFLTDIAAGQEAVVFALGAGTLGPTTVFSDVTRALIPAMRAAGARRLVAITGVGAGETRGHGGFLYDRIIFPLFTRRMYVDKDRQEALIRASDLDWTIVRPAPFNERQEDSPLQALVEVRPDTALRHVRREEVAWFVVEHLGATRFLRQAVFFGHP